MVVPHVPAATPRPAPPLLHSGWLRALATVAGSLVIVEIAFRLLALAGRHSRHGAELLARSKRTVQCLALAIAAMESVHLAPAWARAPLQELARLGVIAAVAWILIRGVGILIDLAERRFDIDVSDNRRARRAVTQLGLVRRVLVVAIGVLTLMAMLTSLPQARGIGTGLLASAGFLGIIAGIAGQSTLGNLIAGLQLAFSDSLRIDDVVVVENEWGTIEEITLTYVVVKIWDERRLVLPVSYFISKPFENWTRTGAQILGSVMVYSDYTVPVDDIRQHFRNFVQAHPLWDGRVAVLQVSDSSEHAMQLRALVSAANSGQAWDLRCAVREDLIGYLMDRFPEALPRSRVDLGPGPGKVAAFGGGSR